MNTFFDTLDAKKAIKNLYHTILDELSIGYEFIKIETSFGDTNIIVTGSSIKPPLVLLHGTGTCAPLAIESLIGLLDDFKVFAIDIVGQPNLSEEIRPTMEDASYGQWIFEILTRLKIQDAVLVGIDLGGFISWKALVFDAKRIAKAFLLVPSGIVRGDPMRIQPKINLPLKLYQQQRYEAQLHQLMQALLTAPDQLMISFLNQVFLHFELDDSAIPQIQQEEAQKIKTPIYFMAADDDLLFPGEKLLKRAKDIFPSFAKGLLLENAKHFPSAEGKALITQFIKKHAT